MSLDYNLLTACNVYKSRDEKSSLLKFTRYLVEAVKKLKFFLNFVAFFFLIQFFKTTQNCSENSMSDKAYQKKHLKTVKYDLNFSS